jgi:collagen type III alpha
MNKAQQPNVVKDGSVNSDANNRPESSPQTHPMGQPGGQSQGGLPQQQQQQPPQPPSQQQSQPNNQQSTGPGTAPQTPVSNPGTGMTTEPPSGILGNNSQQTGNAADNLFGPDFLRDMVFEPTFLGTEGADINFERDFGQWFNPDEMQLDLK